MVSTPLGARPPWPVGAVRPIAIVPAAADKAVGRERKKTVAGAPRRVVLSQPPHYGRIGMQPVVPRLSAAEHGAVQTAQFEREYQTMVRGRRSTVRC